MTNYFVIWHVGHGGGGWLLCCCNNHPAGIWLLGEMHKPNQLDFLGRELVKEEALQQETWNYFEDAELERQVACGIVKSFSRPTVEWVWEHGGRSCQMIRNPIAKCVQQ